KNGVAITTTPATIITGTDTLRYVAPATQPGTQPSFIFQVKDDGGTANGGVDVDQSPNSINITVTITPPKAPVGIDSTINARVDAKYTFAVSDIGFSDPNDTPPNSLLAVKISTLPTRGQLVFFNGTSEVAVTTGQFVSAVDIAANKFRYIGVPGQLGTPFTTFTFQVQDNGGTASGGVDLDQSPNTMTVNVLPVSHAPSGIDFARTINED